MKVFKVKYDTDDQLINIPHNLPERVKKLNELKSEGYTHIIDRWMAMYTGEEITTIESYIIENESYL
tara:strand:- start:464 stop:664 length:201 start_codon:yes stop_codon:yes gene_type:complete